MSASLESSDASETTGFRPLALAVGGLTGRQHGEIGLGKPLTVSAGLAKMAPEETDRRLVEALERSSGRRPVFQTRVICPNVGPVYEVISRVGWPVYGEEATRALDIIAGSFKAAPADKIASEVLRLRMLTRGREQRDEGDREAEATIWIEKLRCYPGDIVVAVLQGWPSRPNGQWWPTWHEVEIELRKLSDTRMSLLSHVRRMEKRQDPALLPTPADESPEERERVVAEVTAKWGEHFGISSIAAEVRKDQVLSPDDLVAKYGISQEEFDAIPGRMVRRQA